MRLLVISFFVLMLSSCTEQKDKSEPTREEIINLVQIQGEKISLAAQQALGRQLQKAMVENGPVHAAQFCNATAFTIIDTLKTELKATIKRASLRVRNPKDKPTLTERAILDEYMVQLDNGTELKAAIEVLETKEVLFAKPILLNNPMCLNCHGKVGSQVLTETYELIHELYPNDEALNHELGDLRGIWSITFAEDEVINYLKSIK